MFSFVEVKPTLKNDLEPQTINVGDELVYRLIVEGRPIPTVKFYKDGNEVGPVTIEQPTKPGDTTVTAVFRIPKAAINDQGEYQASVENPAGVVKTKKVKVTVQQVPVFLKSPEDASVSQGKDVTYEAQLSAYPVPKVTWLLNGKPLAPNADCAITFDTPTQKASLTLKKVDADKHAGTITCQVENPAGKVTHDVKLDVRTQPKITKPLKDESIVQGQDITLSIESSGNPAPKPEWYFNDKPIPTNDQHYQIITPKEGNLYELKIKQTKPTDEGVYKVVMKNSEGDVVSQAKLDVHTPPVISSLPPKIEAVQGQQVIIPCKISGHPKAEITFLKDKKDVTTLDDKSRFRIEQDDKTGDVRLIISDVKEDDQGKYTIRAKNPAQTIEDHTNLIVTAPLSFIDKLQDTDVISGQNLTLTCRCQGIPKPTIKWYQNDIEIKSTTKQKLESHPDGTQTLTVNRVDLTDGGEFKIIATNPQGTVTSTCHVDVLMKPKIDSKPQDIQVLIGEQAELNVKLSGVPKPKIQWFKDGQPVNIDNKHIKTIEKDDICTLIIDNTQLTDKGVYTLKATNKGGEAESPKLTLNVQQIKPSLKSDLNKDITAQIGETIPLTIKVSGTKPKVKWYRNGEEVVETVEENYEIIEEEDTYTLLIKNAKPKNSAEYQAVISNDVGEVKSKKVKVQVQKAPELKKKPQPLLTVKEGEPARFECEFDGNPTPKVSWLRDGKPLTPKDGYAINTDTTTGKSILTINQTTIKHSGPITLRLENSVDTIEETVHLQVESAPKLLTDLNDSPAANTAKIGDKFFLEIRAQGNPRPKVTWLLNGQELSGNSSDYELVVTEDGLYRIIFHQFHERYLGEYQAIITSTTGTIRTRIIRVVGQQAPMFTQAPPKFIQIKTGEKLTIECMAKGHPTPKITWLRDGKVLSNKDGFEIKVDEKTGHSIFIIPQGHVKHTGKYECKVENQYGTHTAEINIEVLRKFIKIKYEKLI
jgi:hemicentin